MPRRGRARPRARRGAAGRPRRAAAPRRTAPSCAASHSTVSIVAWCSPAGTRMRGRARRRRRPGRLAAPPEPLDREVDRLGAAAGEDDLDAVGAERGGDALARLLEQALGLLAGAVDRRGVADHGERGGERLDRLGAHRGGRGVVEVDRHATLLPVDAAPRHARWSAARGSACTTNYCRSHVRARSPAPTSASGAAPTVAASGSGPSMRPRSTSRCSPTATSTGRSSARRSCAIAHGVWEGISAALVPGARYGLRVDGPAGFDHAFNPVHTLLDPYARGLAPAPDGSWRGVALASLADDGFDWAGTAEAARAARPHRRLRGARARLLEAQPRDPRAPPRHLRRARPRRLAGVPHRPRGHHRRAPPGARVRDRAAPGAAGPPQLLGLQHARVLRAARALRLGGRSGRGRRTPCVASSPAWCGACTRPASRWCSTWSTTTPPRRAARARRTRSAASTTRPTTATTRTAATSTRPAAATRSTSAGRRRSASSWTRCGTSPTSCRSTGSASTSRPRSGATTTAAYTPEHPLLRAMLEDPILSATKLIAEPWDVGPGGWQTGNFPAGFSEWNDRYRDRMRDFWLGDLRRERETGTRRQRHRPLRHPAGRFGEHLLAWSAGRSRASTS